MLTEKIGEAAMLDAMAEECNELAHACLKMSRKLRGVNPTPLTESECEIAVAEEMADVIICLEELKRMPRLDNGRIQDYYYEKLGRMKERLEKV